MAGAFLGRPAKASRLFFFSGPCSTPPQRRRFADGHRMIRALRSLSAITARRTRGLWRRYGIFWLGAILVGLVAVLLCAAHRLGLRALLRCPQRASLAAARRHAGRRRALRLRHATFLPRLRRQRHSSGHRRAAWADSGGRRAAAHLADSRREDRRLVRRDTRRTYDRPRRPDRADRRGADVQHAALLSALQFADRTATRARGRGGRPVGGVQHAARGHRVRDRGTHAQLRSARERRAHHGHHHRGRRRARAERQLHVLRHDSGRRACSRSSSAWRSS